MSTTMINIATVASTTTTTVNQTATGTNPAATQNPQPRASLTELMNRVNRLHKSVTDEFDIDKAQSETDALSKESLKWVLLTRQAQSQPDEIEWSNPMPMALELTQVLCSDKIQLENELLYQLAKICRLFIECFYCHTKQNKSYIYPETKFAFIQNLKKILSIIPEHKVGTRYELHCAKAVAGLVKTGEYFFQKYIPGAADAVSDLSIGSGLKLGVQLITDLNTDRQEKLWVEKVLALSWTSQALIHNQKDKDLLKQFYEGMNGYEEAPKLAFCAVEGLAALAKKNLTKPSSLSLWIKGEGSRPGLLNFVDLQISDTDSHITKGDSVKVLINKVKLKAQKKFAAMKLPSKADLEKLKEIEDPFWKVRYRVMAHLYLLFSGVSDASLKKEILDAFAAKIDNEKIARVNDWLKQIHTELSKTPEKKEWNDSLDKNKPKLKDNIKATEKELNDKKNSRTSQSSTPQRHPLNLLQSDQNQVGRSEDRSLMPSLSSEAQEQLELEILLLKAHLEEQQNNLSYFFGEERQ